MKCICISYVPFISRYLTRLSFFLFSFWFFFSFPPLSFWHVTHCSIWFKAAIPFLLSLLCFRLSSFSRILISLLGFKIRLRELEVFNFFFLPFFAFCIPFLIETGLSSVQNLFWILKYLWRIKAFCTPPREMYWKPRS